MSPLNPVACCPLTSGRSDLEIDQDLSPTLQEIRESMKGRFNWKNSFLPISKKVICSLREEPIKATFKVSFCVGTAYIAYLLTRGVFAGIEVDNDSRFADLFSSHRETRLYTGLNLTNGDQSGQFMIDGLALGYLAFKLVFQSPYCKFAAEVINECYKPHLMSRLTSMNEEIELLKLAKQKEEIDRLYKRLEEDLRPYEGEPVYYRKVVFIPPQPLQEV